MSTSDSLETNHFIRVACLCLTAQRVARSLARQFDKALRPLDLTSGQFSLLSAVNQAPPPRVTDVAARLGLDRTTLTAALKPLTRRGLVDVCTDPTDRRGRRLVLTDDGRALLNEAIPIWRRCHDSLERALGQPAVDRLRSGLDEITG
ncbi:MAG TPA: MarR family winged helix-turn-helix transcriptional regulator [Caulobacteraceae bacterium]